LDSKIFTVEEILSKHGPLPSSEIKKHLLKAGVSEEAARQRISRAKGKVRESFLKLPKRESFLYLDNQYGNFEYWTALMNAHLQANSSYGAAISSILARENVIPSRYFDIVSGSPKRLSKHLSSSTIQINLIKCGFLKQVEDEELGMLLAVDAKNHFGTVDLESKKISLFVENIIIYAVSDWLKKTGIASYNKIDMRAAEKNPYYGQFGWDITAPSYIHPLVQKNNTSTTPGFVVVDVVNGKLDENNIKYFINKCRTNRQFKKMRPFLALLVAERFTPEAFNIGKQEGIIFTTPEILFGKEIAESLKDLTDTLKNAAAVAASNPDKLTKLLSSLTKIEGAAINLRGALFELIVGHLVYISEGNTIDIGVKVSDGNRKAEIDVRRVKGNHEVALYECKGKQPTTEISEDDIKKWIKEKIPIMHSALLKEPRFKQSKMIFEYWTTGIFSEQALILLNEYSDKTKKYSIRWKDGRMEEMFFHMRGTLTQLQ
jgi:hypothetical protein